MISGQQGLPAFSEIDYGDTAFTAYVERYYHFSAENCVAGVIRYAEGADAYEIAIFQFANVQSAQAAQVALASYLKTRLRDFEGYMPEQAQLIEQGRVTGNDNLAVLLILPDNDAAERVLSSAKMKSAPESIAPRVTESGSLMAEASPMPEPVPKSTPTPEPISTTEEAPLPQPETDSTAVPPAESVQPTEALSEEPDAEPLPTEQPEINMDYDHDAILLALESGDNSGLSEKNAAILQAAENVVSAIIAEDMTPYQKELAIHDWMIANAQFDYYNVSHHPEDEPGPDNENPYGFFYSGWAVCCGYASTFQLLMDMAGIPCMSVKGLAGSERAPHVWNMVQLDEEWYYVDISWDDPLVSYAITAERAHKYFNVTSEYLKSERHEWNENEVPEATGTKYAWKPEW